MVEEETSLHKAVPLNCALSTPSACKVVDRLNSLSPEAATTVSECSPTDASELSIASEELCVANDSSVVSELFSPTSPSATSTSIETFVASEICIASVASELFAPIGAGLRLLDISATARTSRAFAERVREELARRDSASRRLWAWSSHAHWDFTLARKCMLDWKHRRWNALPPMEDGRVDAVCAMIGNFIYVCGGLRRGRPTNAAERFNLDTGAWESLPPLLGRRCVDGDAAVGVLAGHLYICGGLNFDRASASSCVDRFDPEERCWQMLAPMPERRSGSAAVVLGDRLYICGGASSNGAALPVLSFEPQQGWESLPTTLNKHYRPLAIVANSTIYIAQRDCLPSAGHDLYPGSCDGGTPFSLSQGERFHTNTNTWSRCQGALLSSPGASVASIMSSCLYLCDPPYNGRPISQRCVRVVGTERSEGSVTVAGSARVLRRNWTT